MPVGGVGPERERDPIVLLRRALPEGQVAGSDCARADRPWARTHGRSPAPSG
jgi:hypothetical protein